MGDTTALIGLHIRLERTIDRPCAECSETAVIISSGAGPHVAALRCICCDRHRGWLPKTTVDFLAEAATLFGRSTEPILIRNSQFAPAKQAAPMGAIAASTSAPLI